MCIFPSPLINDIWSYHNMSSESSYGISDGEDIWEIFSRSSWEKFLFLETRSPDDGVPAAGDSAETELAETGGSYGWENDGKS